MTIEFPFFGSFFLTLEALGRNRMLLHLAMGLGLGLEVHPLHRIGFHALDDTNFRLRRGKGNEEGRFSCMDMKAWRMHSRVDGWMERNLHYHQDTTEKSRIEHDGFGRAKRIPTYPREYLYRIWRETGSQPESDLQYCTRKH